MHLRYVKTWRRVLFILVLSVILWQGQSRLSAASAWQVVINIPARTLVVYLNEEEWGRFPVAVGKMATPTPEGNFTIVSKVVNPTWFPPKRPPVPPGPQNPLGKYWLGLSRRSYGIHGNNRPTSIGHPVSNGCIRMRNNDVKRLFDVLPLGTPVRIIYRLAEVLPASDGNSGVTLAVYPDIYQRSSDLWNDILNEVMAETLDFVVHEEALRWLLGDLRPQQVKLPRVLSLAVDGESLHDDEGFLLNSRVYLPQSVLELFGGAPPDLPPFIPVETVEEAFPGGFVLDLDEDGLNLRTIRVFVENEELPIRALYHGEPLLELEYLLKALKLVDPMITAGVNTVEDKATYGGRSWIRLSQINQLSGQIMAEWDPIQNRIKIAVLRSYRRDYGF